MGKGLKADMSTVAKKAGEIWNGMTAEQKREWEELAARDKIRYEEDVKILGIKETKRKRGRHASPKPKLEKAQRIEKLEADLGWQRQRADALEVQLQQTQMQYYNALHQALEAEKEEEGGETSLKATSNSCSNTAEMIPHLLIGLAALVIAWFLGRSK